MPDFIFGGMENTTATTLTDLVLLDERAALDHDVDALVAHELAHQWFGDLLTCRDWSEGWLNEGFATYFEYVWREHAKGRDEADLELLVDADGYFAEAGRYRRPIVCRQYDEPIDLFDATSTRRAGGCCTCCATSSATPRSGARSALYARKHAHGSVETRDLARAVEEATGRNVDGFFDQWIARAGHPELEGRWDWDDDRKVGHAAPRAEAADHAPRRRRSSSRPRCASRSTASEQDERVSRRARRRTPSSSACPTRPTQVIFDPGDVVLKSIKLEKARALWRRQLAAARLAIDRVAAARALGRAARSRQRSRRCAAALRERPFWAVRGGGGARARRRPGATTRATR